MPFVESFTEFEERMGCPHVRTERGILFENGAVSDGNLRHWPPPDDEFERLRAEATYWQRLLDNEVNLFKAFRNRCLQAAALQARCDNPLPGPSPNAPEQLRAGQQRIEELREHLREIHNRLQQSPEAQLRRRHEEAVMAERRRQAALASEIEIIDV